MKYFKGFGVYDVDFDNGRCFYTPYGVVNNVQAVDNGLRRDLTVEVPRTDEHILSRDWLVFRDQIRTFAVNRKTKKCR